MSNQEPRRVSTKNGLDSLCVRPPAVGMLGTPADPPIDRVATPGRRQPHQDNGHAIQRFRVMQLTIRPQVRDEHTVSEPKHEKRRTCEETYYRQHPSDIGYHPEGVQEFVGVKGFDRHQRQDGKDQLLIDTGRVVGESDGELIPWLRKQQQLGRHEHDPTNGEWNGRRRREPESNPERDPDWSSYRGRTTTHLRRFSEIGARVPRFGSTAARLAPPGSSGTTRRSANSSSRELTSANVVLSGTSSCKGGRPECASVR